MKTSFPNWSLMLVLAALPLAAGCDQQSAISAPATPAEMVPQSTPSTSDVTTNVPSPEAAQQQLENAPVTLVSTPESSGQAPHISGPASEIVKLGQAGVDETVMLSYVTNSQSSFNLNSDDIIYLNDIGIPSSVVTAMIQHDQGMKQAWANAGVTPPPEQTTPPVSQTTDMNSTQAAQPEMATTPTIPEMADNAQAPPDQANVTSTYFYDSLAPYGTWIDVAGYGMCWQPSVVVVNRGWTPYCDSGRWIFTDCGWYWVSDYSWGWAPFHYGRWFRHSHWGWCWVPDTVWSPAWVSWRSWNQWCGWAPLPPAACFTPGFGFTFFGRSVGASFSFGLAASSFTFIGATHFCDPHPLRWRVPQHDVTHVFNNSVVANQMVEVNHRIVNRGIPVERIASATQTEIRPVRIQETSATVGGRAEQFARDGRTLAVFRPALPTPTHTTSLVGQGIRPAPSNFAVRNQGMPGAVSGSRQNQAVPVFRNQLPAQGGTVPRTAPSSQRTAPLILRGPSTPANNRQSTGSTWTQPQPSAPQTYTPRSYAAPTPQRQSAPVQNSYGQQNFYSQQNPNGQANSGNYRQEQPKYNQQDTREFTQPASPQQNQGSARQYQWAPAAEPREQQRTFNPAPSRPEPNVGSAPMQSAPARVEQRQAQPVQSSQPQSSGNQRSGR